MVLSDRQLCVLTDSCSFAWSFSLTRTAPKHRSFYRAAVPYVTRNSDFVFGARLGVDGNRSTLLRQSTLALAGALHGICTSCPLQTQA